MSDAKPTVTPTISLDGLSKALKSSAEVEIQSYVQALSGFPELENLSAVVVPLDFDVFVNEHLQEMYGANLHYSSQRRIGAVAGKTLHKVHNGSLESYVVLPAGLWSGQDDGAKLVRLEVVGHELLHVIRDQKRFDDNPADWGSSIEGFEAELAQLIFNSREEYLVGKGVNGFLRGMASEADGTRIGLQRFYDLLGLDFWKTVHEMLNNFPAFFLDRVTKFKTHQIPIEQLWKDAFYYVEELLTALAHWATAIDDGDSWPQSRAGLESHPTYLSFLSAFWPALHANWATDAPVEGAVDELVAIFADCGLTLGPNNYIGVDWTEAICNEP